MLAATTGSRAAAPFFLSLLPVPGPLTRVAVCEEWADGQEDFRDGQGWTPVVLEDVQTDHPLAVDITVVDSRPEGDLGENAKALSGDGCN